MSSNFAALFFVACIGIGYQAHAQQLTLTWQDESQEDLFRIQRKAEQETAFTDLATVEADSETYIDTAISWNTTYIYRVRAENSQGVSGWSNEATGQKQLVAVNAMPPITVSIVDIKEMVLLPIMNVAASSDDGNVPANTIDNDLNTRWSADGDGQWIQYDLGSPKTVSQVAIAWYKGDQRVSSFEIHVSVDQTNWTPVLTDQSSGTTNEPEIVAFTPVTAQYVRIVGHGNNLSLWNSITEVDVYGGM